MEILNPQQITEKRTEIEQELVGMLQETGSDFTLDHIKDVIFNEDATDAIP